MADQTTDGKKGLTQTKLIDFLEIENDDLTSSNGSYSITNIFGLKMNF